jgi:hypothetical protein
MKVVGFLEKFFMDFGKKSDPNSPLVHRDEERPAAKKLLIFLTFTTV